MTSNKKIQIKKELDFSRYKKQKTTVTAQLSDKGTAYNEHLVENSRYAYGCWTGGDCGIF